MSPNNNTTRTDRLNEAHERLVQSVASLTTGNDWQTMLEVARKFHCYSASNLWLILSQRPEATRVAGFHTWRSLGRQVRAGEHGIAILAPCIYKTAPDTGEPTDHLSATVTGSNGSNVTEAIRNVLRGFKVVHVFDIDQTDGAELPSVDPHTLAGDVSTELWERLARQLERTGFHLLRGECRSAYAETHFATRTVVVQDGLAPAQATKSLAHEVAHTMLHDGTEYGRGCRGVTEIEAESVAYLVCAAAGIVTDRYSFPYVARWSEGNVELVRTTAERVITCARQLVAALGLDVKDAKVVAQYEAP